jgi:hypothetical protein
MFFLEIASSLMLLAMTWEYDNVKILAHVDILLRSARALSANASAVRPNLS